MAQNLQSETFAQSVNSLIQVLQNEDSSTRQQEIDEILKEFDNDKAVSLLFDAFLKSFDTETRTTIIEEIAKVGNKKAVEILESIASDDYDNEVARKAVSGLEQIGTEEAIDALLDLSGKSKVWVRDEAVSALGNFKSDKVIDYLIEATKDYFVANRAVSALQQIGSDRAVDVLIETMQNFRDCTGDTSWNALYALMCLGTDKAIDGLFQAWRHPIDINSNRLYFMLLHDPYNSKQLIIPLRKRLQDSTSSDIKKIATEILGLIGTEEEIPFLQSIWREYEDKEVSWMARRAAEQIALRAFEQRKQREHALEENRAFMAHEFRHALVPLNAYVKMLEEEIALPTINREKINRLTKRIHKQLDTTFSLLNQYLDYSRALLPQFVNMDINTLLNEILEEFKTELDKKNITLKTRFEENVNAEIDKQMLEQVLRNVLTNAMQAIDKDGCLNVAVSVQDRNVVITMRDTGTGIKAEHLERIFDIGFTTKSNVRGAGIGLALSKRIIEEAHRGSITIANNTDGKGATVTISLPIKQTELFNGKNLTLANS